MNEIIQYIKSFFGFTKTIEVKVEEVHFASPVEIVDPITPKPKKPRKRYYKPKPKAK